jgi:6-pyruvoyltetrahydropterin/6-carboxytetrahydropterin synthase
MLSRVVTKLFVGQDVHKFSAAHMTVFPDGTKERLHGHNFNVSVALELKSTAFADLLDMGILKRAIEKLCREWNERILVAERCPHLEIRSREPEVEIVLCGKRYVAPAEDVVFLPIDNVIVETLAEEIARRLLPALPPGNIARIDVEVTEARGQGARCSLDPGLRPLEQRDRHD